MLHRLWPQGGLGRRWLLPLLCASAANLPQRLLLFALRCRSVRERKRRLSLHFRGHPATEADAFRFARPPQTLLRDKLQQKTVAAGAACPGAATTAQTKRWHVGGSDGGWHHLFGCVGRGRVHHAVPGVRQAGAIRRNKVFKDSSAEQVFNDSSTAAGLSGSKTAPFLHETAAHREGKAGPTSGS